MIKTINDFTEKELIEAINSIDSANEDKDYVSNFVQPNVHENYFMNALEIDKTYNYYIFQAVKV